MLSELTGVVRGASELGLRGARVEEDDQRPNLVARQVRASTLTDLLAERELRNSLIPSLDDLSNSDLGSEGGSAVAGRA